LVIERAPREGIAAAPDNYFARRPLELLVCEYGADLLGRRWYALESVVIKCKLNGRLWNPLDGGIKWYISMVMGLLTINSFSGRGKS
jgi:hypothetical protein